MKNNSVKLRKIKNADWPYFLKWWKDKELIMLTGGVYEDNDNILKGYFLNMLHSDKDQHFIIIFNDKTVGNISITRKTEQSFEIHIVIGEKTFWGKGIGTAAINKALTIAFNKLGYKKAYLEVRPGNKRAVNTYKYCGFKEGGLKKYPNNKFQPVVLKMSLTKDNFLKRSISV